MPVVADIRPAPSLRIFVVIAAYNEGPVIGDVVRGVREVYQNVVVVDDGSTDDTSEQAGQAGAAVVRHLINRGQGAALQSGITYALRRDAEAVVTFDADGQHRVQDIADLLAPIEAGEVEICLGSRFLGQQSKIPIVRRLILRAAILFMRLSSSLPLSDAHNGLRALSRRAAQQLDIQLDRMAHASEIIDQVAKMKLPYREVPVKITYTEYSMHKGQRSSSAFKIAFDYLVSKLLA